MTQECSTGKKTGYAIVALILFIALIPRVLLNVDGEVFTGGNVVAIGTINKEAPSIWAFGIHFVVFLVALGLITWAFEKAGDDCKLGKEVDDAGVEGDDTWLNFMYIFFYALVGYLLVFFVLHMSMKDKTKTILTTDNLASYTIN
jgi:hypothetical protein